MSAHWLKRLVLAAAFAAIPLQGPAAVMATLPCHGDASAHEMHQDGAGHGASHENRHDEGSTTGDGTSHPCCQVTISALPVLKLPAQIPDFPIRALAADPLHERFIPDQPQRPPLA